MKWARTWLARGLGLGLSVWLLSVCDPQRIGELEEGVSTEADVRERFGSPEAIWDAPDGAQVYEYNRQPAGHRNYMITIGADGRMAALRQVLTPHQFAQVLPGMPMESVRRMLGKPMKVSQYATSGHTHYDWRYLDGPNASDSKVFTVVFDRDLRVVSTQSVRDPDLEKGSQ